MSQTFAPLVGTDTLTASRTTLNNNIDALKSAFSGTSFPATNLVIGMEAYRTDQSKIYRLTSTGPSVWTLVQDLSKVPAFTSDLTGFAGKIVFNGIISPSALSSQTDNWAPTNILTN